jgi:hypothetical protein
MEPISPNEQGTIPAISLTTLRTVLAKGQAAHPELAYRMDRAAHIVALRRIEQSVSGNPQAYWVQSEYGDREYWVSLSERGYHADHCTCPDYQNRGGPCKHAIAVRLLLACERTEAGQAPTPLPTPTLDPDAPIPFVLTEQALAVLDEPQPVA